MTTQETAQKYGVALPETCIKLEWKFPTNFYWILYDVYELISDVEIERLPIYYSDFNKIPAPQMHEIAPLLPKKLLTKEVITI